MSNASKNQSKAEDTTAKGTDAGTENTGADYSKQLADLGKQVEALSKQNQALHKRLSDVEKENAAFKAAAGKPANEPPAKPVTPTDIYTSESGDKYRFLIPVFNYSGNVITAVDALADSEIMEALIEMKSGVLKKLA